MIRKIMHRPQAVLGLAMMLLVFLVMLLAPVFAPNDPMQLNVAHSFAPPDAQYPLGTDELGRCILSRLIYGARASLSIALPTLLSVNNPLSRQYKVTARYMAPLSIYMYPISRAKSLAIVLFPQDE